MKTLLVLILAALPAFANQMTSIGLGTKNQSLANSSGVLSEDAFSQNYNPAVMSYDEGIQFAFSIQGATANFNHISQVLVDTPNLGASTNTYGDIDTKPPDTFNLALALKLQLNKSKDHPFNAGIVILTPADKVMGINTEDSFLPQYSMYLADTQHFGLGVNFSYKLSPTFSVGAGGQVYFVQAASSALRLVNGGNSTARIRIDVRPGIAPVVGLIYSTSDGQNRAGLSYWGKQDSRMQLDLNNYISTFSSTAILVTGKTSLFYDPDTLVLSLGHQDEVSSWAASANLEKWSAYAGSAMTLSFQTFTGSFSQNVPSSNFHDTISLHLGHEQKLGKIAARIGYAFVPTPVPDQSGDLNYLDSDKHEVGLGLSFLNLAFLHDFLGEHAQLDIGGLVHYLVPKTIVKVSSASIGAPGYTIGGLVYSYGVSLSTQL